MWKDWVRPFVRPLPQWSAVAVVPAAPLVTAALRWDGQAVDVTADHTVASLHPLTIASSVDGGARPVLEYRDGASGRLLGRLQLVRDSSLAAGVAPLAFYRVEAGEHRCLAWPLRPWNAWLQNRGMAKHAASNHLNMPPAAAQQLMIAYLCPRPVVLVSVAAEEHRNIFPMDLIGPLERSGLYSLALRSTNVSEPVLRDVRKVALSHVPAAMKGMVYKLAAHHRQPPQDWNGLPLPLRPSREFGIPVVAGALRIQELAIVHSQIIGSHTFFLARTISSEDREEAAQLHHTAGFHQAYRRRRHQALPEV
ncbi:flavin reductase (DIM6/NTAB) family NADH-FMN oxidoreductase RutF [Dyella sp. SG562]|uniref:flavin reductase n=1 Tax=Dyella sp. SG562 TaxID=2587017 RepID=UPI00142027C7|nr:flavin reductase [Dyella sp. SG562]NII73963.1 flavin reductase (DIM6/NTAB) family NADH-FMN oxidoreductase RutF [Dyella sp. SG562]